MTRGSLNLIEISWLAVLSQRTPLPQSERLG